VNEPPLHHRVVEDDKEGRLNPHKGCGTPTTAGAVPHGRRVIVIEAAENSSSGKRLRGVLDKLW
jgi:hypothetical protein